MFGHQDNQPTEQNDQLATTNDLPDNTSMAPVNPSSVDQQNTVLGSNLDSLADNTSPLGLQHHEKPLDNQKDDVISPAGGFPKPLSSKGPSLGPIPSLGSHPQLGSSDDNQLTDATDENLVEVKQKALEELFPLIDKLDQTSEEHFKTLMMIIQASDNHTLIEKAYQVAQTIDDEKVRAQALLDIVNEINYFTQQPEI